MSKFFGFKSLCCMAIALSALVLLGGVFSPAYAENVTFQAGPGGTISGASLQSVPMGGSTVGVSAVPLPGYTFASWTVGGLVISTSNPLTVTNVTSDMTVTANFTAPPPLTVTFQAGPGGTISGASLQSVPTGGSTLAVTAVPLPGYTFASWTVGGLVISTSNPLTVTNVTSDMTVTANFTAPPPLTVTFQAGPGGTISGASLQSVPMGGSTVGVSAVPLPGYTFVNWTGTGGFLTTSLNPLTVSNVTANMTITANFTAPSLTVTFQAGPGGTISGASLQSVPMGGSTVGVSAVPLPGYTFVNWTGTGGFLTTSLNPLTVTNVTSDMTVTANFTAPSLTVTFQAGPGGTISGASLQSVPTGGSTLAVTAVPLPGYTFVNWTGTGGFLTTSLNPLTVSNVTANMTVTANFLPVSNANVFFQAGPGGTISGASLQSVPTGGSTLAVSAVPLSGWTFASWTVGGLVISTSNPLTVTNVTADMTVTANFQTVSNVSPVAMNGVLTTTSGVSANGLLSATDANGDYLTYRINQQGLKGTATLNPVGSANFTYMPSPGAVGTDSFLYIANDGKADSNVAMVMIDIQSVTPFVTRTFPAAYTPGVKLTVTLTATPPPGTSSYSVTDKPPAGWTTVSNISNGGIFDTTVNEVRFLIQNGNSATLTYDITPPASETGDKIFSGTATRDGGAGSVIGGKTSISKGAQTHPADISSDFTLTDSEVTGYVSAWLRGNTWELPPNPIPASYAVRAAGLWLGRTGGKYKFDSTAGNAPYCWLNTNTTRSERDGTSSTAVRQLPSNYIAGQKATVSIVINFGTKNVNGAYSIEDMVPSGWAASDFMSDGKTDTTAQFVNGNVQFFFYDKLSRTVSYKVMPPTGETGTKTFSGTASFFSEEITITGISSVSDAKPAMGDVNGSGGTPDLADAILALRVLAGITDLNVVIADVNSDNRIGLEEVIYILQKVAGLR